MLVKSAAASKQQRIAPSANARSSTTISRLTMYSNDNYWDNWFESIWLGNNNIQQSTTVMDSDAAIITNIVEISAIIDLNDVGLCHPS